MKESSRHINFKSHRINQAYGARHFRGLIETNHYFLQAYKYVYRNPVQAGLSETCEDYRYSSLNFLLGKSHAGFPVVSDDTLFDDVDGTLDWLNLEPKPEHWETIGKALKKSRFKIRKCARTREEHPLNYALI